MMQKIPAAQMTNKGKWPSGFEQNQALAFSAKLMSSSPSFLSPKRGFDVEPAATAVAASCAAI